MRTPGLILAVAAATATAWGQCEGPEPVAAPIFALGHASCVGRVVRTEGVVTLGAPGLQGFFTQGAPDGNTETSDGIFVFLGTANVPAAGTVVTVTGRLTEFRRTGNPGYLLQIDGRTSATPLARVEAQGHAPLPDPVEVDPRPDNSEAHLRARLGMRVRYPASAVMQPTNRFGEYWALRLDRAPRAVRPTVETYGDGVPILIDDVGDRLRVETKSLDRVPDLLGVLHFDFGLFRIQPETAYPLADGGLAATRAAPASPGTLRIASMNVERLVRSLSEADRERKIAKLARVIREQLLEPEVIGVQEVEDQELLAEVGRRAGGYQAIVLASCDFGRISVGVLWKTAHVRKLSEYQLQQEAPEFRNGRCTLPDGRQFTQYLYDRPPLIVDLAAGDFRFTVAVNHWRSQIGGNERERTAGAMALAEELRRARREHVIVLGDLNDWEGSVPVLALAIEARLHHLSYWVPAAERYSLLFEGLSQAYDHILVSDALGGRVLRAGYAHFNADFPVGPFASDATTPIRSADHDPMWVVLRTGQ